MFPGEPATNVTAVPHVWDADMIFQIFKDPVRRRFLLALARCGPLPQSKLKDIVGRSLDTTMKRMLLFRSNKLVTLAIDPTYKRRQICSLVPTVPIVQTEKGRVLDFGYLKVPLDQPAASSWDQDTVYFMLGEPRRRKLLRALFKKPLQTGIQLANGDRFKRDGALKQLAELRSAGFVVAHENETDGRCLLYSLAPGLPLETTDAGTMMQFGFCAVMI